MKRFKPKSGAPSEHRLAWVEEFLARNHGSAAGGIVTGNADNPRALLESFPLSVTQESEVEFFATDGHDHTTSGTAVPLASDLSGTNQAATVIRLRNVPLPAPVAGDTGKAVTYNHAGLTFAYAAVLTSAALARQTVDGWYRDAVAASLAAVVLARLSGAAPNAWIPVRAGSITGLVVRTDNPRTAGTLTVEVYKNGAATGLTAVLDGASATVTATTQASALDPFAAGDQLDLRLTTDAGWLPAGNIRASMEVTFALET